MHPKSAWACGRRIKRKYSFGKLGTDPVMRIAQMHFQAEFRLLNLYRRESCHNRPKNCNKTPDASCTNSIVHVTADGHWSIALAAFDLESSQARITRITRIAMQLEQRAIAMLDILGLSQRLNNLNSLIEVINDLPQVIQQTEKLLVHRTSSITTPPKKLSLEQSMFSTT